jgi:hypothetical protein
LDVGQREIPLDGARENAHQLPINKVQDVHQQKNGDDAGRARTFCGFRRARTVDYLLPLCSPAVEFLH